MSIIENIIFESTLCLKQRGIRCNKKVLCGCNTGPNKWLGHVKLTDFLHFSKGLTFEKNATLSILLMFIIGIFCLLPVPVFMLSILEPLKKRDASDTSPPLRFLDIVRENYQYEPALDICYTRIVGGAVVPIEMIPYQVALIERISYTKIFTFCGASLVTPSHALTAAHCLVSKKGVLSRNLTRVDVVGGLELSRPKIEDLYSLSDQRKVKNAYKHINYDPNTLINDFCVVEVVEPFSLSQSVAPVRLHSHNSSLEFGFLRNGISCGVSGFGRKENNTLSSELRLVCIPIVPRYECITQFGSNVVPENTVCAGETGADSCKGDSGGPLVCSGVQVGILSYGGICGRYPAVYTAILKYTREEEELEREEPEKIKTPEKLRSSSFTMKSSNYFSILFTVINKIIS